MQHRVIAILVARSGAEELERTLSELASQSRAPDVTLAVGVSSAARGEPVLASAGASQVLNMREGATFSAAVAHAMQFAPQPESGSEWLWLLRHDNVPHPNALAKLLGAVEIAPSVGIAGPKLMDTRDPTKISEFGQTISRFGATVSLVTNELDQAQHDRQDDVLAVSAGGMLVRRSLWKALGGFDPGLPSVDAALDFSIRARLAGYRVILVPEAQVASAGGPELFDRANSSRARGFRLARAAQLHRRLVYSPAWAVWLHWLSLVPLAILRSIGHLIGKHPGAIGGELWAAFTVAFSSGIGSARRNLKRGRKLGWAAIAPLRMPVSEVRERRIQAREEQFIDSDAASARAFMPSESKAGFIAHGGLWVVALTGLVGVLAFGALLGSNAISGGALRPIVSGVAELWSNIGLGWRHISSGMFGAADPFAVVLAGLGSMTWWSPTRSIVLVYLLAMPLAALGAWFASRRFSRSPWLPALAALIWGFAPPLLAALTSGQFGAVVAHILLPWLVLAAMGAARSWASGAAAALLFAAVAAGAPSLVPALLVLYVVLLVAKPARMHRAIGIPIPALVLFAPLIVQQLLHRNPLGLLADPGVPVAHARATGWQLALGDASGTLHGWTSALATVSDPLVAVSGVTIPLLVSALLAPLGVLALLSLFLPGSARAVPMLLVALLGYLSAVLSSNVMVGAVGAAPVTVWAGSGLSLMWLGLIGAACQALDGLGRAKKPLSVLAALTTIALAIPMLGAFFVGTALVHPSDGRILPALVSAQAADFPHVGTLVITSHAESGIAVRLERGLGAGLDDQSTLISTKPAPSEEDKRLAVLAGNLATRSGFDFDAELSGLGISFVLVTSGNTEDETYLNTVRSLNANEALSAVGNTSKGMLWRFTGEALAPVAHISSFERTLSVWYPVLLGGVFGVCALLAIPVGSRPRSPKPGRSPEEPAGTFLEDDNG